MQGALGAPPLPLVPSLPLLSVVPFTKVKPGTPPQPCRGGLLHVVAGGLDSPHRPRPQHSKLAGQGAPEPGYKPGGSTGAPAEGQRQLGSQCWGLLGG